MESTDLLQSISVRATRFVAVGAVVLTGLSFSGCQSFSSTSKPSPTQAPAVSTMQPTTMAPAVTPTTVPQAPPCTNAAIAAALPATTTILSERSGGIALQCEGGFAGVSVQGDHFSGVQLFQADGVTWKKIDRTAANCAKLPASIYQFCTVS